MRKHPRPRRRAPRCWPPPRRRRRRLHVTGGKLDWTIANQLHVFGDPARTWLGYVTFNHGRRPRRRERHRRASTRRRRCTGPDGAAAARSITTASARGLDQLYTFSYPVAAAATTPTRASARSSSRARSRGHRPRHPDHARRPAGHAQRAHRDAAAIGRDRRPARPDVHVRPLEDAVQPRPLERRGRPARGRLAARSRGIVPRQHGRHRARRLRRQLDPLRHDEPDARRSTRRRRSWAPPAATAGRRDRTSGANGKDGANGRDAELRVIRLTKAPFTTTSEVHVRLIDRATGKTVATGTVERSTLRLGVLARHHAQGHLRAQAHRQEGHRQAARRR